MKTTDVKTAIRVMLACALVIGTYTETGIVTASAVLWGYFGLEITGMAVKRLADIIRKES